MRTVLEATARLLEESGYDALTTRHVAKRAGISVGSLYQYFPNKESLVLALFSEHLREAAALRPAALDRDDLTLDERVRIAVGWFLDAHAAAPGLHRALTEAAAPVLGAERIRALERAFHRTVYEALKRHADEIRRPDLELAAFVYCQTLEALTHSAVVHHPERLAGEALRGEITDLLLGYLRGAAVSAPATGSRSNRRTRR